jgi:hypothetical protein
MFSANFPHSAGKKWHKVRVSGTMAKTFQMMSPSTG